MFCYKCIHENEPKNQRGRNQLFPDGLPYARCPVPPPTPDTAFSTGDLCTVRSQRGKNDLFRRGIIDYHGIKKKHKITPGTGPEDINAALAFYSGHLGSRIRLILKDSGIAKTSNSVSYRFKFCFPVF